MLTRHPAGRALRDPLEVNTEKLKAARGVLDEQASPGAREGAMRVIDRLLDERNRLLTREGA